MPAPDRRRGQAVAGIQFPCLRLLDSRLRVNDVRPQILAVYVGNGHLERRSRNRSESQDEQTPSPLMGESRGGGEARHSVRLQCKGYRPVEIPVNYASRSFAEGKKNRPFRDPPTWIRALVKYRLVPIGQR